MMSDLQRLRQEHTQLVKLIGRFVEVIAAPSAPPPVIVSTLRHELSATLVAHLEAEDMVLYPLLIASGDAETAITAREYSDEMGGLAAAYMHYVERWDAKSIAGDWAAFRDETRNILGALSTRISRENRTLYPLLEALPKTG